MMSARANNPSGADCWEISVVLQRLIAAPHNFTVSWLCTQVLLSPVRAINSNRKGHRAIRCGA